MRLRPLVVVSAFAAGFAARRRLTRWGATDADQRIPLPGGDRLLPEGRRGASMATTIDAPPAAVWPWLVQMGMDRGGWYSFDRLDNAGRPSASDIVPAWQHVAVGDRWPSVASGRTWFEVVHVEAERALSLRARISMLSGRSIDDDAPAPRLLSDSTWEFLLRPLPDGRTRLVVAGRDASRPRWLAVAGGTVFWEPVHVLMQVRQLREIRRRAERAASAA